MLIKSLVSSDQNSYEHLLIFQTQRLSKYSKYIYRVYVFIFTIET